MTLAGSQTFVKSTLIVKAEPCELTLRVVGLMELAASTRTAPSSTTPLQSLSTWSQVSGDGLPGTASQTVNAPEGSQTFTPSASQAPVPTEQDAPT